MTASTICRASSWMRPSRSRADGSVSYVDGANIAGFAKVADAMLAQGVI